ncbi:MAG: response regulator [Leptolyngbyaceae cyanobacterium bins.302]|nr:response regulator [Leptolyngbyaceae cyanobacterium bins.302]
MKILLIEDDQCTCDLISATLTHHRYAVDTVADGIAGLDLATRWIYDLILLDILLPTLNGIEVCRRLRIQGCQTPVLILTMKDSNEDIIAGLDAGADDYLAKTCDSSQLLARVRALLRRSGNTSSSPLLTWGDLCLDPAIARVTYKQDVIMLRPKEYTLLELFLRHPHRIFSRSAIIEHLWSMDDTPVEGAITNLIKDLRHRLKSVDEEIDLIETVYGLGYRLKEAPTSSAKPEADDGVVSRNDSQLAFKPVLTPDRVQDWSQPSLQRGKTAIQRIQERFQASLDHRIATLETADRCLQAGHFSLQQRQTARAEAHKLAGGLGTFGCGKASEIAQAIEDLLEANLCQEALMMNRLPQLLEELKQELAHPLSRSSSQ